MLYCCSFMKPSLIYFDDICVLCSRSVRFISKNDPKRKFQFASLHSDHFARTAARLKIDSDQQPDSIVLIQSNKIYSRTTAVIKIAAGLRFPWPLFTIFILIPRFIRNPLYDLIARNRYRLFGKRESCFVPEKRTIN